MLVAGTALWMMSGCASEPQWMRYEVCFGLSVDSGRTPVTEEQWREFRDAEIAPRFPDGFTLCPGEGFWRSGTKTYLEPAKMLLVVAPDTEETRKKLTEISAAYARRFLQESVLEVRTPVTVDFHRFP